MSIVKTFQNTGSVPEVAVHKFSIKIKFEVVATIRTPKQADRAWEITKKFFTTSLSKHTKLRRRYGRITAMYNKYKML